MQSTRPLCFKCQQNPAITTPRNHTDLAEVYNRTCSEYRLSASQKAEVEQALLVAQKDFDDYESEILHLQSRIAYIRSQQARLEEHMPRLRSLSSPMRRMPNEVLCRIFDYGCETNLLQEFPWGSRNRSPPTTMSAPALTYLPAMAISSVSAQWRSIAVSLPGLWSRMSLEISYPSDGLPKISGGFADAIQLYLLRSGEHVLDMTLDVKVSRARHSRPTSKNPFDLICDHCSRWRSFRLRGEFDLSELAKSSFDHPPELPVLEELDLDQAADIDYFKLAPIQSLSVNDWDYSDLRLSSNCLTTVDMPIDKKSIELALDQFPNLMQLLLWECPSQTASAGIPPKRYNSITSLSLVLAKINHQDAQTALHSLTLPSLVNFKLEVSEYAPRTDEWSTSALVAFLRRSEPSNLTTFTVRSVVITDSDLFAALQFMPSLINLTIDDATIPSNKTPITSRFIRSLHGFTPSTLHSNSSTALLPNLRSLKLYFDGPSFDDAAFIDLVSSRWLPDVQYAAGIGMSCLKTVVMNFRTRAVDEEVYRPLQLIERAGMMIVVLGKRPDICSSESRLIV